jgi:hypothetical protein
MIAYGGSDAKRDPPDETIDEPVHLRVAGPT